MKFFKKIQNNDSLKLTFLIIIASIIVIGCLITLQLTVDFNDKKLTHSIVEKINISEGQTLNLQQYINIDLANNYKPIFYIDNIEVSKLAIQQILSTNEYKIFLNGKGIQKLVSSNHILKIKLFLDNKEVEEKEYTFRTI